MAKSKKTPHYDSKFLEDFDIEPILKKILKLKLAGADLSPLIKALDKILK